jgi:hypothetical protein
MRVLACNVKVISMIAHNVLAAQENQPPVRPGDFTEIRAFKSITLQAAVAARAFRQAGIDLVNWV